MFLYKRDLSTKSDAIISTIIAIVRKIGINI